MQTWRPCASLRFELWTRGTLQEPGFGRFVNAAAGGWRDPLVGIALLLGAALSTALGGRSLLSEE